MKPPAVIYQIFCTCKRALSEPDRLRMVGASVRLHNARRMVRDHQAAHGRYFTDGVTQLYRYRLGAEVWAPTKEAPTP